MTPIFPPADTPPCGQDFAGLSGSFAEGSSTTGAEPWPLLGRSLGLGLDLVFDQLPCHLVGDLASDGFEVGEGGALGEAVGIELPPEFPRHLCQTTSQLLAKRDGVLAHVLGPHQIKARRGTNATDSE